MSKYDDDDNYDNNWTKDTTELYDENEVCNFFGEFTRDSKEKDIRKRIWISDIYDRLYHLLNYHINYGEYRLKVVGVSDILSGKYIFKNIKYDQNIIDFINDFLEEIENILDEIKTYKLYISEEDMYEFNNICSLHENKLYYRISYCFNKHFI